MKVLNFDDDDDDDDERKKSKKAKFVSNARSHDDQFCPKIVKIGAILGYFWPLQSLRRLCARPPRKVTQDFSRKTKVG